MEGPTYEAREEKGGEAREGEKGQGASPSYYGPPPDLGVLE